MSTSLHLAVHVDRSAEEVYRFAADPARLPQWAAGLSGSIEQRDGRWFADSPMGEVEVRFAPDAVVDLARDLERVAQAEAVSDLVQPGVRILSQVHGAGCRGGGPGDVQLRARLRHARRGIGRLTAPAAAQGKPKLAGINVQE